MTIAAISTPSGKGGISIVRLSGKNSLEIAQTVFYTMSKKIKPRHAYFGTVKTDTLIDHCILIYFKAPKSYTGEDIVELQIHGSNIIATHVLNALIKNGARLAENGEFTKRALLNGKLSVSGAEGIMELINAESESEVRLGFANLQNHLHKQILEIESLLYKALSYLELNINYCDEGEQADLTQISILVSSASDKLAYLAEGGRVSRLIRDGITLTIAGKPNVGKSSILNKLVWNEKAIVTDIPGTTRDIIEASFTFDGILFNVKDTAGIRDTDDNISSYIEKLGIERSISAIKESQIVLFVIDNVVDENDFKILKIIKKNSKNQIVLVSNKSDQQEAVNLAKLEKELGFKAVKTNTVKEDGLIKLKEKLKEITRQQGIHADDNRAVNARQLEAVTSAQCTIRNVQLLIVKGIEKNAEAIAGEIKQALEQLAKVSGKNIDESLLKELFSNFCVGK